MIDSSSPLARLTTTSIRLNPSSRGPTVTANSPSSSSSANESCTVTAASTRVLPSMTTDGDDTKLISSPGAGSGESTWRNSAPPSGSGGTVGVGVGSGVDVGPGVDVGTGVEVGAGVDVATGVDVVTAVVVVGTGVADGGTSGGGGGSVGVGGTAAASGRDGWNGSPSLRTSSFTTGLNWIRGPATITDFWASKSNVAIVVAPASISIGRTSLMMPLGTVASTSVPFKVTITEPT